MKRHIIVLACSLILSLNSYAKVVKWTIPPEYDSLKPYSEEIYYCQRDAKWGLISTKTGRVLLAMKYDFITPMVDGHAVAGIFEDSKNKIVAIINDSYSVIEIPGDYYLVNNYYTYFSEDKLPVSNKFGKQGFIDTNGELIIKCQFDNVHPFSCGLASVNRQSHAFYITSSYDKNRRRNVLSVDFCNGNFTLASTFHNDTALVVSKYGNAALINNKGQVVGIYDGWIHSSDFNKFDHTIKSSGSKSEGPNFETNVDETITAFSQKGLYGYVQGVDTLAFPSFDYAEHFLSTGFATAKYDGNVGLLSVLDGSIDSYVTNADGVRLPSNTIRTTLTGGIKYYYAVSIPEGMTQSDFSIYLDNGHGEKERVKYTCNGNKIFAEFMPAEIIGTSNSIIVSAQVCYQGIVVHKFSKSFGVTDSAGESSLVINGPITQTSRANEKDEQVILATIFNKGAKDIIVLATLSVKERKISTSQEIKIPAYGKKTINLSIPNITRNTNVTAALSLSIGKTVTKSLMLKPYY